MAKKKNKKPFGDYTFEQILSAEEESYVIQVGCDLFDLDGKLVFDKPAAAMYYNQILKELVSAIEGGSRYEKKEALRALCTLRIHPLRIN